MPSTVGGLKAGPKSLGTAEPLDLSMLPEARDWRRVEAFAAEFLTIPKGKNARQPFTLEPFQRTILKQLFPAKGKRPRQALTAISRGNGKSTLAALVALYCLYADGVEGAQVLVVAADLRQAGIVFGAASRMVQTSPELASRTKVYQDRLMVPGTAGEMFPLPANEGALQGYDPSAAIVDELAFVPAEVWESVTGATGKRDQSLVWAISTPPLRDDSVMHQLVTLAKTEPRADFAFLEWTSNPDHPLDCMHCWRSANPALGRFLQVDGLRSVQRTMRESSFRRLRLGQFVAVADDQAITPEVYAATEDPNRAVSPSEPIVLAFDGSFSGDCTALVGVTISAPHHVFVVGLWKSDGSEGYRVPVLEVEQRIRDACKAYNVREVCADPFRWARSLQILASDGLPVSEFPQSDSRMTPATTGFLESLINAQMTHVSDTDLRDHFMNARVREDARGTRLLKDSKMSSRKIDLCVAAVMGWARASHYAAQPKKSAKVWSF